MTDRAPLKSREPPSLESRIAAGLNGGPVSSEQLAELIRETEQALAAAVQEIAALRETAADLVAAPDGEAAFAAVERAQISRDRLTAALPRLKAQLSAALAQERHARWLAEYSKSIPEHDALKDKIAEVYPRILDELDELEDLITDYNGKADRINTIASALPNEHRRLPLLSLGTASAAKWGPPGVVNNELAVTLASGMTPAMPHPSDRWWDPTHPTVAAQRQAMVQEREAIAAHHERAAKEQEARENREERERFARQQRRG